MFRLWHAMVFKAPTLVSNLCIRARLCMRPSKLQLLDSNLIYCRRVLVSSIPTGYSDDGRHSVKQSCIRCSRKPHLPMLERSWLFCSYFLRFRYLTKFPLLGSKRQRRFWVDIRCGCFTTGGGRPDCRRRTHAQGFLLPGGHTFLIGGSITVLISSCKQWLLGYEFPSTIFLFRKDKLSILCSASKGSAHLAFAFTFSSTNAPFSQNSFSNWKCGTSHLDRNYCEAQREGRFKWCISQFSGTIHFYQPSWIPYQGSTYWKARVWVANCRKRLGLKATTHRYGTCYLRVDGC